jgi:hypothetical protein
MLLNVCSINSTLSNRSVAMQPNKTKISLIIGAMYLGVSGASYAASEPFIITATTIADVLITEDTPLDFGANVFVTTGTCSMDASDPGEALLQVGSAADTVAVGYGDLSGDACIVGNTGTPGVYTVSGASGTEVNITLGGITTADFTFTPDSSAYSDYTGVDDATADAIGALSDVTTTTDFLAADDEDDLAIVSNAVGGELVFTLGGTLTILQELTPETTYNAETFTVSVTY